MVSASLALAMCFSDTFAFLLALDSSSLMTSASAKAVISASAFSAITAFRNSLLVMMYSLSGVGHHPVTLVYFWRRGVTYLSLTFYIYYTQNFRTFQIVCSYFLCESGGRVRRAASLLFSFFSHFLYILYRKFNRFSNFILLLSGHAPPKFDKINQVFRKIC